MEIKEKNICNIYRHTFLGNFDTGILMIFIPLFTWNLTGKMLSIAYVYIIPIIINIIFDYLFSILSDKYNRKKLSIIGNLLSGIVLCFFGLSNNIYFFFSILMLKSVFDKLYSTSLDSIIRTTVSKEKYNEFLIKNRMKTTYGAALGGQLLMLVYYFSKSYLIVFILSGVLEIISSVFLLYLETNEEFKKIDSKIFTIYFNDFNNKKFQLISILLLSIPFAMIYNRMIIFSYDVFKISTNYMGAIFFIVYAVSNTVIYRIKNLLDSNYKSKIIKYSYLITIFVMSVLYLINTVTLLICCWLILELASSIIRITINDEYNKKIDGQLGKASSIFRITYVVGTFIGTLIIGWIIDRFNFRISFLFSSFVMLMQSIFVIYNKGKIKNKEVILHEFNRS